MYTEENIKKLNIGDEVTLKIFNEIGEYKIVGKMFLLCRNGFDFSTLTANNDSWNNTNNFDVNNNSRELEFIQFKRIDIETEFEDVINSDSICNVSINFLNKVIKEDKRLMPEYRTIINIKYN